ncbi:hypothetical protein ACOMHN_017251 [Nucella lapillus]
MDAGIRAPKPPYHAHHAGKLEGNPLGSGGGQRVDPMYCAGDQATEWVSSDNGYGRDRAADVGGCVRVPGGGVCRPH